MNEHNLILLILAVLIVGSIILAYCTPVDVSADARGLIRTNGAIRVMAEVTGKVANVYMRQAQTVHAGDALVQLDTQRVDHDLHILQTRIHVAEAHLKGATDEAMHARLRNLYQQLELTELARAQLTVISPADGVLDITHGFRIGERITGGAVIATIIPSDRDLTVEARISESVVEHVHVGQAVSMQPDDHTHADGLAFPGVVEKIMQETKPRGSAAEYIVAIVPNDDSWLRYERELRVKFLLPQKRLLRIMVDRLKGGIGELWRLNKINQPGNADPGWLSERLRRAG